MTLTSETEVRINGLLDVALQGIEDQALVAASRCVDALLDLYGSSDDTAIRQVCTAALRRIGKLSLVVADEFRADLDAVAAAAATSGTMRDLEADGDIEGFDAAVALQLAEPLIG